MDIKHLKYINPRKSTIVWFIERVGNSNHWCKALIIFSSEKTSTVSMCWIFSSLTDSQGGKSLESTVHKRRRKELDTPSWKTLNFIPLCVSADSSSPTRSFSYFWGALLLRHFSRSIRRKDITFRNMRADLHRTSFSCFFGKVRRSSRINFRYWLNLIWSKYSFRNGNQSPVNLNKKKVFLFELDFSTYKNIGSHCCFSYFEVE